MNVTTTDQIALVTGANRGIGRQFVLELLERGASKVYATGRRPESLDFDDPRVVPLRLDIVDHESVIAAAATARDVTILVNNAGISTGAALVTGDLDEIRREMDTHFFLGHARRDPRVQPRPRGQRRRRDREHPVGAVVVR